MKVALAILNWNGSELLQRFLPDILLFSKDAEVYVIDNASSDDSIAVLKEQFPKVGIIRNNENLGFTGGYNKGLQSIEADIYCLLNSDVRVTENWLVPILKLFENDRNVAIAQPKILDLNKPNYFEYAGAGGGFIDKLGYPFCRGRIFQALEKDKGQYNDITEIFWATGACMFVKSEVFKSLGGFDEDYFAHQEEVDLCWRAKNAGHTVYYVGESSVYHMGGFTLQNSNPYKTFLNFRNSLYTIVKNLPAKYAWHILFSRLMLDGIAAVRFALQFRGRHAWAVFRAHLSFYRNFKTIYRKREKTNFLLKYYPVKSIVWSHFVHQINNFNILVKD
ncbi:MAG: glycosyltransferase family 2 protein [Bacteroidota bacterium]